MTAPLVDFSLWLMPSPHLCEALATRMHHLADRLNTPRFIPHVTIQGDIPLDHEQLVDTVARLAALQAVQHWPVTAVDTGAHYFRCLYLSYAETAAYNAMKTCLAHASGTEAGLSQFPHLSLAYGVERAQQAACRNEDWSAFLQQPMCFDHLAIAHCSSRLPIAEWRILDQFALIGS